MKTIFEYTNVSASDRLEALATGKLTLLKEKFRFLNRADVYFTLEQHKEKTGHICAIRLSVPGNQLYASTEGHNFVEAISETTKELEEQLRKQKEKMSTY